MIISSASFNPSGRLRKVLLYDGVGIRGGAARRLRQDEVRYLLSRCQDIEGLLIQSYFEFENHAFCCFCPMPDFAKIIMVFIQYSGFDFVDVIIQNFHCDFGPIPLTLAKF